MNLELVLALIMAVGIAGVFGVIAQSVLDMIMDIQAEEDEESFIRFKRKRNRRMLEEESWFNFGDEVLYKETEVIIIGHGLNDTVSVLIDDVVLDVPVNELKKIITLQ